MRLNAVSEERTKHREAAKADKGGCRDDDEGDARFVTAWSEAKPAGRTALFYTLNIKQFHKTVPDGLAQNLPTEEEEHRFSASNFQYSKTETNISSITPIFNVNFKGKIPYLENNKKTPLKMLSMNNSYDFKV